MKHFLLLARWLSHLVLGADGKLSASKLSYLLFVAMFTRYMWLKQPDDAWMWVVYGGLVGGVEVCKKYISSKYIGLPTTQPGAAP